ncbi:MAG: M48 family metallopeptidase [Xenococcaceae cyanobacterium MO_167.B52]|nr:M48 family metallopeptidase [Xenococcaceae cyanobacterium MO_167.B52]
MVQTSNQRKTLTGLSPQTYEHPFDQKALVALEKMPGVSLMFNKINQYGIDRLLRFKFSGMSLKVNERNFPDLYNSLLEACKIVDVPVPELYLKHGTGYIKILTIGANNPMIIINMDGLECLNHEELLYVFGHELGHIKSRHLLYHQTALILPGLGKVIANSTLGLGGLATNGVELALYQWVMMAKLTCDRCGLLACQDVNIATSALIKLSGLPGKYINGMVVEEFLAQAREFGNYNLDNLDKFTKMLSFMEPMHPWTTLRTAELLKWIDSGEYKSLLLGEKIEQERQKAETNIEDTQEEDTQEIEEAGEWDFLNSWETDY